MAITKAKRKPVSRKPKVWPMDLDVWPESKSEQRRSAKELKEDYRRAEKEVEAEFKLYNNRQISKRVAKATKDKAKLVHIANRGGGTEIPELLKWAIILFCCAAIFFAVLAAEGSDAASLQKPLRTGPTIIAVIDSGYDAKYTDRLNLCKHIKHRVYTNTPMRDLEGHGTNVGGLIVGQSKAERRDYCLVFYKVFDSKISNDRNSNRISKAVSQAVADGASIINISLSGRGAVASEYNAMREAVLSGALLVVAAGNENIDLDKKCDVYPVCYPLPMMRIGNGRIVSIEPEKDGKAAKVAIMRHVTSNYGKMIGVWIPGCDTESVNGKMCGTSQSAAIASGKLVQGAIVREGELRRIEREVREKQRKTKPKGK